MFFLSNTVPDCAEECCFYLRGSLVGFFVWLATCPLSPEGVGVITDHAAELHPDPAPAAPSQLHTRPPATEWVAGQTSGRRLQETDIELVCLSLTPFYLPREFGNILLRTAYIPPGGNAAKAANIIADCVHSQLKQTPEAPCFILGDFNHCKLEVTLPGFSQYVNCSTRGKNILDKCYGNIKNAYTAKVDLLWSQRCPFNPNVQVPAQK